MLIIFIYRYDTVGLHLIGGSSPVLASEQPKFSTSSISPSTDRGYSRVARPIPPVPSATPPPSAPANGYSKIGPKSGVSTKKPATGYSEVYPHRGMNGMVVEDSKAALDLTLAVNGIEKASSRKQSSETSVPAENSEMSR